MNHVTVVLAGAAAHFMTGWVLCSDMVFGKFWKQDKKACLHKDMRVNLALQFAASLALSAATVAALVIFEKAQAPSMIQDLLSKATSLFLSQESMKGSMNALHTAIFIWAGFIVPTSASEVIWCGHHWKSWVAEMVAKLLELAVLAAVVTALV